MLRVVARAIREGGVRIWRGALGNGRKGHDDARQRNGGLSFVYRRFDSKKTLFLSPLKRLGLRCGCSRVEESGDGPILTMNRTLGHVEHVATHTKMHIIKP